MLQKKPTQLDLVDAKIIQVYKIGMEAYKSIYSSMIDNEMSKYLIIFAR